MMLIYMVVGVVVGSSRGDCLSCGVLSMMLVLVSSSMIVVGSMVLGDVVLFLVSMVVMRVLVDHILVWLGFVIFFGWGVGGVVSWIILVLRLVSI